MQIQIFNEECEILANIFAGFIAKTVPNKIKSPIKNIKNITLKYLPNNF